MKTIPWFTLSLALLAGCTAEQQLENAREDLAEERAETVEAAEKAQADGVVTEAERKEVREELGETAAAEGEVAEQAGELIQKRADE